MIILGFIVLSSLIILITMGGTILTVVLSVVYPAYKSIKALQTDDTDEDDKIWLTYWCVFGTFTLVDEFLGFILQMIPFYYWIKLGFFVWMMHPATKGATVIYRMILKPLLERNKDSIEKFINEVKGSALDAAKQAASEGMK